VKRLSASLAVVLFVACASVQILEVQDADFLYFGTARPGGIVSDTEWKTFVDEVITPRFPGFTEWKAVGHWESAREATYVVQIIHPHRGQTEKKIAEIIDAYKKRFSQEAVFWMRMPAVAKAR
jgi:Protein of unknown function (DUF3574)